jgi:hypothetical protein
VLPAAFPARGGPIGKAGASVALARFHYVAQFGNDDLKEPSLMVCDRAGRLHVADRRLRSIFTYTPDGVRAARWEIQIEDDEMVVPSALAADRRGNILVADTKTDRVLVFSPSGKLKTVWYAGDSSVPADVLILGIAEGAEGNLWFSDHACDCLYRHDGTGTFRDSIDFATDAGPGPILAFAPGKIAVLFPVSGRIGIYTTGGKCRRMFGRTGSGDGALRTPGGFASWRDLFFVADTGNNRIQVFDSNGAFKGKFGRPGYRAGELDGPAAVAVLPSGRVFVLDRGNHRIQEFERF